MVTIYNSKVLKEKENFLQGIGAGLLAGIVFAIAYGLLLRFLGFGFTFAPLLLALCVGRAMQFYGKGVSVKFGIVAMVVFLITLLFTDFSSFVAVSSDLSVSISSFIYMIKNYFLFFEGIRILIVAAACFVAFKAAREF